MGKGGCSAAGQPLGAEKSGLASGWNSLISALQSITSSRWADEKIDAKAARDAKARKRLAPSNTGKYSWEDVRQNSIASSCWLVVKGKVYDVTEFAPMHPGGNAIVAYAGRDATDVFAAFHASDTWSKLRQFYIGDVEDSAPNDMLNSFRKLRADMLRAGLFRSSKSFYAWKLLSLISLYVTAVGILLHGHDTWAACICSTFLLALSWQQSGWLAHDFLHHQVFRDRRLNNAVGYFVGCVCQGFSPDWWKNKHNTHHAVPNECTEDAQAVDPDIDTLPLLAWSEEMLQHVAPGTAAMIRNQHYLFFPILCFARMAWAQQSFLHAWALARVSSAGVAELVGISAHYLGLALLAFWTLSLGKALAFMFGAQVFAGFMLALVFVQSHNAMEVHSDKRDFVSAQIHTTRNINSSLWMDWFTGGLNYQIEHHLFPTLPRHNLPKVKAMVMKFCRDHQFVYESCGMDAGTYRVLQRLAAIAAKV